MTSVSSPISGPPPAYPPLSSDALHVLVTWLDGWAVALETSMSVFSTEERRRARRLPTISSQRFLEGRMFLRRVLARYAGCSLGEVSFRYGPNGKPALANDHPDIRFNLSHSRGLAVCAVSLSDDVGVDVEVIREMRSRGWIADRVAGDHAWADVLSIDDGETPEGFFRTWTRREAISKLLGNRLMAPPADSARGDGVLLPIKAQNFAPCPGWVGAVAARGARRVQLDWWLDPLLS